MSIDVETNLLETVFFITGTDTNVGKTFVSSLLVHSLKLAGNNPGYMKPVETGVKINEDGTKDYIDCYFIKKTTGLNENLEEMTPFTYEKPLSPYAASKYENKKICIKEILYSFYDLKSKYNPLIVEGAGGMLAPLKSGHFMIDLARYMEAQIIIVTKAGLGMINHTLLSINYADNHNIKIAGVIINNALNEKDESIESNVDILSEFINVPIIGNIPYINKNELYDIDKLQNIAVKYIDIRSILS